MSGHKGTTFQFWSAASTGQVSIGVDSLDQGYWGTQALCSSPGLQPRQHSISRQCTSWLQTRLGQHQQAGQAAAPVARSSSMLVWTQATLICLHGPAVSITRQKAAKWEMVQARQFSKVQAGRAGCPVRRFSDCRHGGVPASCAFHALRGFQEEASCQAASSGAHSSRS